MIFSYSNHAIERLLERGISKEIVEATVLNPDKQTHVDDLNKAIKRVDDNVFTVIFKEINGIYFVITAYKSSNVSRYLG